MLSVEVVRVFVDHLEKHGNLLGVLLDPSGIDAEARLAITRRLGFAETVFVDNLSDGLVEIYSPEGSLPFAGHPLVGTGWLLNQLADVEVKVLRPPVGEVPFWIQDNLAWIIGNVEACPAWSHIQLETVEKIEALKGPLDPAHDAVQYWSWQDAGDGTVRARVFGQRFGVPEDEACGSASMMLAYQLKRAIKILHGKGSVIYARPAGGSSQVAVGGKVVRDASIHL